MLESGYEEALRRIEIAAAAKAETLDLSTLDFEPLPKQIAQLQHLKALNLSRCHTLVDLGPLAPLSNHLQSLNLSRCYALKDLSLLAKFEQLQSLNLYACYGVENLDPITKSNQLQKLKLTSCESSPKNGPMNMLHHLQKLKLRNTFFKTNTGQSHQKSPASQWADVVTSYRIGDPLVDVGVTNIFDQNSTTNAVEIPKQADIYVSYVHNKVSKEFIHKLEQKLPSHLTLKRDINELKVGDKKSHFVDKLVTNQLVLVLLSEQYLRSISCMQEMLKMYELSLGDSARLLKQIVPIIVDEIDIDRANARLQYVKYWKNEEEVLEKSMEGLGLTRIGKKDREEQIVIQGLQTSVSDILAWVSDILMPKAARNIDDAIDAVVKLLEERL